MFICVSVGTCVCVCIWRTEGNFVYYLPSAICLKFFKVRVPVCLKLSKLVRLVGKCKSYTCFCLHASVDIHV